MVTNLYSRPMICWIPKIMMPDRLGQSRLAKWSLDSKYVFSSVPSKLVINHSVIWAQADWECRVEQEIQPLDNQMGVCTCRHENLEERQTTAPTWYDLLWKQKSLAWLACRNQTFVSCYAMQDGQNVWWERNISKIKLLQYIVAN